MLYGGGGNDTNYVELFPAVKKRAVNYSISRDASFLGGDLFFGGGWCCVFRRKCKENGNSKSLAASGTSAQTHIWLANEHHL